MPVARMGKKRGTPSGATRATLNVALKGLYADWKAANRSPKGQTPSWVKELAPAAQEQYRQLRQQASKVDSAASPPAEAIGKVVLDFWLKKHSK